MSLLDVDWAEIGRIALATGLGVAIGAFGLYGVQRVLRKASLEEKLEEKLEADLEKK